MSLLWQCRLSRRAVLGFAGGVLIAGAGARTAYGYSVSRGTSAKFGVSELWGGFSRPSVALRIGLLYLRKRPSEANEEWLAQVVFADWVPRGAAETGSQPGTLKRYLAQRVKTDYERGETTQVAGWMLSHTELRACALLACRFAPGAVAGVEG